MVPRSEAKGATVMLFFRIQNEQGTGMYSSNTAYSMWDIDGRHPSPTRDSLLQQNFRNMTGRDWQWSTVEDFRFGFASLAQFRFWVHNDEWLKSLSVEGFELYVFNCPEVIVGSSRAIAKKEYLVNPVMVKDLRRFL